MTPAVPVLLALLAAGGGGADPACDEARLDRLRARIEALRGEWYRNPVPCRAEDSSALARKLDQQWERRSASEWAGLEARLRHFGLIPNDRSLRDVLLPVLGEQVAAYYDDREKRLSVIRRDSGPSFADDLLLLHELDHGLEDQLSGLTAGLEARAGDDDRENAYMALLEGQSTLVMVAAGAETDDLSEALPTIEASVASAITGGELGKAPPYVREELLFPYLQGLRFAVALLDRGGWPLLTRALLVPPDTTRSILHPESWGSAPEPRLRFPDRLDAPLPESARLLDDGELGELELGLIVGGGTRDLMDSVAGWRGDRLRLYDVRGRTAMLLVSEWSDEAAAERFESALRSRLRTLRPAESARVSRRGTRVSAAERFGSRARDAIRELESRAPDVDACPRP